MTTKSQYIELCLFPEENGQLSEKEKPFPEEKEKTSDTYERKAMDTDEPDQKYDLTDLFDRLAKSKFRCRFHLSQKDREYITQKGLPTIRKHAEDFIAKRLAPAVIPNDGKQTPMRGHPVFLAQHATGCCCRGCFYKWHHIPPGRALSLKEQRYAVAVLMTWIDRQLNHPGAWQEDVRLAKK